MAKGGDAISKERAQQWVVRFPGKSVGEAMMQYICAGYDCREAICYMYRVC